MPEITQQQVVEYIKGISVLELSQPVKTLEAELGVSAAAAMPMAMPMGGGAAGGAGGPVGEKTDFTLPPTATGGNTSKRYKGCRPVNGCPRKRRKGAHKGRR